MHSYTLPRALRSFLLYIGPGIYIENDILRLVDESKSLAYRHGYAAASNNYLA